MAPAMLREWLAPLAVKELESALDVFEGYVPGFHRESSNGVLSCATDNITVHQKKKKALQIVEFLDSEVSSLSSDRVLLVSDGTSLIKAVFEEDGITAVEQKTGRKVDEFKGATIISEKHNLVFHRHAEPGDALKLHVLVFKLYGGEGARTFGSPVYFSTEPNLRQIFEKLNRLLSGPLASSLSFLSVNSDPKDTPSQMLETQFATQTIATQPAEMGGAESGEIDSDQEAVIARSTTLSKATKTLFHDGFQSSNPFKNMKRVPRKFARIPRDQHLLLDSEDSWDNPSNRVAKLPDSTRQGLATFLERKPATSESSQDSNEDDDSQHSDEEEQQPPERVELNSSERKILKTINYNSSPDKSRPATHNHESLIHEPLGDSATPSPKVSRNPIMKFAVPVEMGEFADDEDEDMPLPSLSVIPPSTARNRSPIVQVKRTPRGISHPHSSSDRPPREGREIFSSNPACIPATHVDLSSQPWRSSVDAKRADEGRKHNQPMIDLSGSTAKPIPSLPPSVEKVVAATYSLQKRKVESASIFPMNPSFATGVAHSSSVGSRHRSKSRKAKRKSRGRTAEDEFFANRELEDPEESVRKEKQKFLGTIEFEREALEDLLSQQSNDNPSSVREPAIEVPASHSQTTQGNPPWHNQTSEISSTSYELDEYQMIDQGIVEPKLESFMDENAPEAILTLKKQNYPSGSSTGPDEEFQPESSPPHLPSPRQVLVDSQELVLSIESEAVDLDSTQDNGHKDKLRAERNLSKGDEHHTNSLDKALSFEKTNIRQKSPTSEEDDQADPLPVPGKQLVQPFLEDENDNEDLNQRDQPEYLLHTELRQPEAESEVEEDSLLEDLDLGCLTRQKAETFQEVVAEERVSQAEFSPEDSPGPASFLDMYKLQYPSYTGTSEDFTTALVYLEWLLKNRKFLPPSFYDDFVNFYPEEYLALGGDKLGKRGYDLFHEKVDEPMLKEKVIFRHNLHEAINSMDEAVVQKNRARFESPENVTPHKSRGATRAFKSLTPAQPVVPPRTPTPTVSHFETAPQEEPQDKTGVEPVAEPGLDERLGIEDDDSSFETMLRPKSVRQRFFDTPSQALPSKRKESPMDLVPSYSSAKKHRTLPWQNKTATLKPRQPQFQVSRGTPKLASPELGDETALPENHQPSTRPISPPPLKDLNRRKTIGTDKVIHAKPKSRSRNSMAPTTTLDVGPKNPGVWVAFLNKNREKLLRQSRSPSVVSSSKRKASRMED